MLSGLSQAMLAAHVGLGLEQRSISMIEHDRYEPNSEIIDALALHLGLRTEFLTTGDGPPLSSPMVAYSTAAFTRERQIRQAQEGIRYCLDRWLLSDPYQRCVGSADTKTILIAVWRGHTGLDHSYVLYRPGLLTEWVRAVIASQGYTIEGTDAPDGEDVFETGRDLLAQYAELVGEGVDIDVDAIIEGARAARKATDRIVAKADRAANIERITKMMRQSRVSVNDLESYIGSLTVIEVSG